jgi:hypothetical protein
MVKDMPIIPPRVLVSLVATITCISIASVVYGVRHLHPGIDATITSDHVSQSALGVFRLCAATFILGVFLSIILDPVGIVLPLAYSPQSLMPSLGAVKSLHLVGWPRASPFTVQSWFLLGIYFLVSGLASLTLSTESALESSLTFSLAILMTALLNLLYPVCLLVSFITTFVLIPSCGKNNLKGLELLKKPKTLIMHNANIILASLELLLNNQQITWKLAGLPILMGAYYVVFTWTWALRRARMVHYSFIDPTLPLSRSVPFHLGLMTALFLFSTLGALISRQLDSASFGFKLAAHSLVVYGCTNVRFAF